MTEPATHGVVASLSELIGLRALGQSSLRARAARTAAAPGSHATPHKSRGMEFAEVRPYQSGDDARLLDWRQTARRGRPYTKLFQEEHERPVQLLVDLGPSMRFGTRSVFKSVLAARVAALLAWRAVAVGDRVGGLVCNGADLQTIRPQSRQHGVLTLLACLAAASNAPPGNQPTAMELALHTLARTQRPGSLIVILSDFTTLDAPQERQIVALAQKSELRLIHVYDIFEAQAPPPGRYRLTDGERSLSLDLRTPGARGAYGAAFAERRLALEQLALRARATLLPLATHMPVETVLAPAVQPLPGWRGAGARLAA